MKKLLSLADVILFTGFKFLLEVAGTNDLLLGELAGCCRTSNKLLFKQPDENVFQASPEDIKHIYARDLVSITDLEVIEFANLVTGMPMIGNCEVNRHTYDLEREPVILVKNYPHRLIFQFFLGKLAKWDYSISGIGFQPNVLSAANQTLWLISHGFCPFPETFHGVLMAPHITGLREGSQYMIKDEKLLIMYEGIEGNRKTLTLLDVAGQQDKVGDFTTADIRNLEREYLMPKPLTFQFQNQ